MAARYFNWKLAIVLLVGVVVFAGAAFALRKWQRNTRAEEALPRGKQAYEQQDWDTAADQLGRYLAVHSDSKEHLLMYADAQYKRRPVQRANWMQAVNAYRVLLRLDNDHAEATARLTELYLQMGHPGIAKCRPGPGPSGPGRSQKHRAGPTPHPPRYLAPGIQARRVAPPEPAGGRR